MIKTIDRKLLVPKCSPCRNSIRAVPIPIASALALDARIARTYRGESSLWCTQEIERQLRCTPCNPDAWNGIIVSRGAWSWIERHPDRYVLRGKVDIRSTIDNGDLCVVDLVTSGRLLATSRVDAWHCSTRIVACHHHTTSTSKSPPIDSKPRNDGYWTCFVASPQSQTTCTVEIMIERPPYSDQTNPIEALQAVKLEVGYDVYGQQGMIRQYQDIILPLEFPSPPTPDASLPWRPIPHLPGLATLAIQTHLLSPLDDPVTVAETYLRAMAQPGDILVLNESALAVMQGRYRNPRNIRPSLLARLACRLFAPASSLASACGMQVLLDLVGPLRVLFALVMGIVTRLVGVRGGFYRAAGEQARLIDDVSGTLPPFDKVIVLGPERPHVVSQAIADRLGIECCVVDANDLRRVDVLGRSGGVAIDFIQEALKHNPAGNADECTPLVLVRKMVGANV